MANTLSKKVPALTGASDVSFWNSSIGKALASGLSSGIGNGVSSAIKNGVSNKTGNTGTTGTSGYPSATGNTGTKSWTGDDSFYDYGISGPWSGESVSQNTSYPGIDTNDWYSNYTGGLNQGLGTGESDAFYQGWNNWLESNYGYDANSAWGGLDNWGTDPYNYDDVSGLPYDEDMMYYLYGGG
jgi:hypothetical protein